MSERPTVTVRNSGQIRYDPDDVYAAVLTGSLTPGIYELVPVGETAAKVECAYHTTNIDYDPDEADIEIAFDVLSRTGYTVIPSDLLERIEGLRHTAKDIIDESEKVAPYGMNEPVVYYTDSGEAADRIVDAVRAILEETGGNGD